MLKKLLFLSTFFVTLVFSSSINIAVASNVSYAINDLIKKFNITHPQTKINVILGSSGKLSAQIMNHAPFGLFMSANMKYPNTLYKNNLALLKPVIYAKGSLAIFSSKKEDFTKGINLVKEAHITRIALANSKTAPYGKATKEALQNAKLYKEVKNKYVYAESISQTVSYSITATDLGFIAKSALFSPKMKAYKKGINWIDIDIKLYTPINQGIVILKNAKDKKEVQAFYDFILSKEAKEIFTSFGYL